MVMGFFLFVRRSIVVLAFFLSSCASSKESSDSSRHDLKERRVSAVHHVNDCRLSLNNHKGEFNSIPISVLDAPPEEATPSGKLVTRDGFYCREGSELIGLVRYKDQSGGSWTISVTAEKMLDGETLVSIIQTRGKNQYGPQLDFTFPGKPCELLVKKNPFALIGQRTEKNMWFSTSLTCK